MKSRDPKGAERQYGRLS